MTNYNEKKTITIPVPAHYLTDSMIAGVKKEELRTMWFGDFEMTAFFIEVPTEMAKDLLKLTWAEVDFDKPKRRRQKAGLGDCEFTAEMEEALPDESCEDPLQLIIDKEAVKESEKVIGYLEDIHKHYGEIFRERLSGTFSIREMERNLGISEANVRRWNKEVTRLAMKYYFKHYF